MIPQHPRSKRKIPAGAEEGLRSSQGTLHKVLRRAQRQRALQMQMQRTMSKRIRRDQNLQEPEVQAAKKRKVKRMMTTTTTTMTMTTMMIILRGNALTGL